MCRHEARDAWAMRSEMTDAGASRIVALVKEDVGKEVENFREYWGGEIFLDKDLRFYKALGGGEEHRPHSLAGFLAIVANPFSKSDIKKNLTRTNATDVKQNLTGEGFVTGGVYVMRKDGTAAYSFLEEELGNFAPFHEVMSGVEEAAKS